MIRFLFKAALIVATAWLAAQVALSFLPGAFAQAPARIARGTRLISAQHAILPEARPARDGLLILYGATFATHSASGLPSCPDTLGGVTVWIGDEPQPLRYVSPGAVIVVPRRQTSWLIVRAASGSIYYAPVRMTDVAPGILIAAGDETGNLFRTPLAVWRSGRRAPEPLTLAGVPASTHDAPTQIAIEGTGWRHAPPASIRATIGGEPCKVTYAGPSGFRFAGQDAITIELPLALTQRGPLDLVVEAAGQRSNTARVSVR